MLVIKNNSLTTLFIVSVWLQLKLQRDAQDTLLWRDTTCPATYLAYHELESDFVIDVL